MTGPLVKLPASWRSVMPNPEGEFVPTWGPDFLNAVQQIRKAKGHPPLRESLDLMANVFGFESWHEWRPWLCETKPDFRNIRGPHAMTLLKMLAIKHGRNVSGHGS